jgi:threonine/homoserine/homoserine lactone efflux protein
VPFAALFPQFLNPDVPLGPQILVLGTRYLAIDGLIPLAMGAWESPTIQSGRMPL